jgi:hypothetical protein
MARYLKPQQLSPAMTYDQERKQPFKRHRRDHAQIDRGDRIGVVAQKRLPALRWRLRPRTMYFDTVDWATSKPSVNSSPWIPQRIVPAHPLDQISQAAVNPWPSWSPSGFPAPKGPETRPVPAENRLGLHDLDRSEEVRSGPNHPCQNRPIDAAQSQARWRLPQSDIELVAKQNILQFKPSAWLAQIRDYGCDGVQNLKHHLSRCDDSARARESTPDGISGKDR